MLSELATHGHIRAQEHRRRALEFGVVAVVALGSQRPGDAVVGIGAEAQQTHGVGLGAAQGQVDQRDAMEQAVEEYLGRGDVEIGTRIAGGAKEFRNADRAQPREVAVEIVVFLVFDAHGHLRIGRIEHIAKQPGLQPQHVHADGLVAQIDAWRYAAAVDQAQPTGLIAQHTQTGQAAQIDVEILVGHRDLEAVVNAHSRAQSGQPIVRHGDVSAGDRAADLVACVIPGNYRPGGDTAPRGAAHLGDPAGRQQPTALRMCCAHSPDPQPCHGCGREGSLPTMCTHGLAPYGQMFHPTRVK